MTMACASNRTHGADLREEKGNPEQIGKRKTGSEETTARTQGADFMEEKGNPDQIGKRKTGSEETTARIQSADKRS
jgi:hypothetical protein